MPEPDSPIGEPAPDLPTGRVLLAGLVGAVSSLYLPPLVGNQNSYFLHGFAMAGEGFVQNDFLAATADPFPLFSLIIATVAAWLPLGTVYLLQACLGVLFFATIASVIHLVAPRAEAGPFWAVWAGLLLLAGPAIGFLSPALMWTEELLIEGLAGHYVLGPLFQPSAFGVLLVAGVVLLAREHPVAGTAVIVVSGAMHAHYLWMGFVVLGAAGIVGWHGGRRRVVGATAAGAAIVAVIAAVTAMRFREGDAQLAAEARRILVEVRFPHHAEPLEWFGWVSAAQVALMVGGLWATRGTRLLVPMAALGAAGLLGTLAVMATGHQGLALLFPWRASVVLVPLATGLLAGRLAMALPARFSAPGVPWVAGVVLVYTMAAGVAASAAAAADLRAGPENRLFAFVRDEAREDWLVLVPNWAERFRLETGVPVLVDFKTHPYGAAEIVAWHRRLQLASGFYYADRAGAKTAFEEILAAHAITHVLVDGVRPPAYLAPGLEVVYTDERFALYRVGGVSRPGE